MYREADEGAEEIATPTRRFSLLDITSELPDDSREAEEREVERRLRDLRGRVKRARAIIASTPGLCEVLASRRRHGARFYARFGMTEELVRNGVPVLDAETQDLAERGRSPIDWMEEVRARAEAMLP